MGYGIYYARPIKEIFTLSGVFVLVGGRYWAITPLGHWPWLPIMWTCRHNFQGSIFLYSAHRGPQHAEVLHGVCENGGYAFILILKWNFVHLRARVCYQMGPALSMVTAGAGHTLLATVLMPIWSVKSWVCHTPERLLTCSSQQNTNMGPVIIAKYLQISQNKSIPFFIWNMIASSVSVTLCNGHVGLICVTWLD